MRTWSAFARSPSGRSAAGPGAGRSHASLAGAGRSRAGRSAAAALLAVLVLPAGPAAAGDADAEQIVSYDVSLDVGDDGSLEVVETIGYDFGGNARHGIDRDIDTEQRYDGSRNRLFRVSDVEVSSPTAPDEVQLTQSDGQTSVRIGDPDRTISGRHSYRISYTVAAATTRFGDRDELYWNAVGPGWSVPVQRVTVRAAGAEVTRATCFSGPPGSEDPCGSATASGPSATWTGGPLEPGDALTVVAAFPAGSVAAAAPVLVDRMTPTRFLAGRPAAALPAAAVLAGLPVLWLLRLRRRRREIAASASALPPGSVTAPPAGVRPALVSTLRHGSLKPVDQVAVLLDLSARGYLSITPTGKREWDLAATRPPDTGLRPEEYAILDAVFAKGPVSTLSKAGRRLASARPRLRRQVYADVVELGWFSARPGSGKVLPAVLGVSCLFLAVPATIVLALTLHAGIVGVALGVAGILLIVCSALVPAPRTPAGEAVRQQLIAFKAHLGAVDPARWPADQRQAAFAGLLPYAVVLALAPVLAQRLAAAGVGYGYADPMWFSTFSTDATRASASSSSGGGSGSSGSSGGGGGGGGGGSW